MSRSYATTKYPSSGGGGGGLTLLVISGVIDDSNVTFTATSEPQALDINGSIYQKTGGNITWTYTSGTITLSSPVGSGGSIFGIGTGISLLTISGTIDDSNVTFTSTSQPKLLVINGGTYQPTGGAITWTYSGGTITLSSPIGTGGSIFGIS